MVISTLQPEIDQIENPVLKEFTTYVLDKAPGYLSEVPSSSTHKYHPPQSNLVPGGLLNHLKATVNFGLVFSRAHDLDKDMNDAVIVACLLHDIVKYSTFEGGIEVKQKYTTKTHDYDGALFVHKAAQQFAAETGKTVPLLSTITGGIAWHMGRWSVRKNPQHGIKQFPDEYSIFEYIVHMADMCAANKNVSILTIDGGVGIA